VKTVAGRRTGQSRRDSWKNLADVVVLWGLAVAQPLYSLLSRQPEFFVARGAGLVEILSFVVILSFGLPLLLFGLKTVLFPGRRLSGLAHFAVVAVLIFLLIFPPVKRQLGSDSLFWLFACLVAGIVLAAVYLRFRQRAFSLAVLLPVVPILVLVFLLSSPIRGLLAPEADEASSYPEVDCDTPIFFVVFDEFPVISIMKENMEIDEGRYPNFASLAKQSTWYRNASSVGESTTYGLPAILDGMYPDPGRKPLPTARDHPRSLFTLLGGSYRFNVIENTTQICPEGLRERLPFNRGGGFASWFSDLTIVYLHIVAPSRFASRLPEISHSWKDFGAGVVPLSDTEDPKYVFEEFLKRIEPTDSTLNYVHLRLPHFPWVYLPNGRRYSRSEMEARGTVGPNTLGIDPGRWTDDEAAVIQGHQRHLLQVGMADWILGRLVEHVKALGIYDRSLFIVTADHGASFRVNDSRRAVTSTNFPEIASVPLFIKTPNQQEGKVDDRNVETVDILPTVADLLGIDLPWKVDGVSLVDASIPEKAHKTLIADIGIRYTYSARLPEKAEPLRKQIERFGTGDWDGVFRVGLPPRLRQRSASDLVAGTQLPIVYEVYNDAIFRNFDPEADILTTLITGGLQRKLPVPFVPLRLVVSVNDRVVAATQSYLEGRSEKFMAVASDADFRRGYNLVELLALEETPDSLALSRLRREQLQEYRLGTTLDFGVDGNVTPYLLNGWSYPEGAIRWNNGKRAALALPMEAIDVPIMLRATVGGYVVPGKIDRQRVEVLLGPEKVGEWIIERRGFDEQQVLLDPSRVKGSGDLVLRFEAPDAVSPFAAGLGNDIRRLAFAIKSLTLSEYKGEGTYRWGETIEFGSGGNSDAYRKSGWAAPEEGVNWTDSRAAELWLHVETPTQPVLLEILAMPFLATGKADSQRLRIVLNGHLVGEKTLSRSEFQELTFQIPPEFFGGSLASIRLETLDAISPRDLGISADERQLGIAVAKIRLSLKEQ